MSEDRGELLVDEDEDGCVFRLRKGRSQLDFEGSFVICFRDEGDMGIGEEGIGLGGIGDGVDLCGTGRGAKRIRLSMLSSVESVIGFSGAKMGVCDTNVRGSVCLNF